MGKVLVVAPHPDDEVLGCGGSMAKFSRAGDEVYVLIVTKGDELFDRELVETGRSQAVEAHKTLGVKETFFADLPAIKLDTLPQYKINGVLLEYFRKVGPESLFIPFPGDVNSDHGIVHRCAMVAARPVSAAIDNIYCYETLSSTNWSSPGISEAFIPQVFVDITETIELKLEALRAYSSQIKAYPHERSAESTLALSQYRGGFVNVPNAEAFMCLRKIVR